MLERCALRHGNVHSADGWRDVLDPVIACYAERDLAAGSSGADAAYAILAIYERLEEASFLRHPELPAKRGPQGQDRASANAPCRAAVTDQGQAFDNLYQAASSAGERR